MASALINLQNLNTIVLEREPPHAPPHNETITSHKIFRCVEKHWTERLNAGFLALCPVLQISHPTQPTLFPPNIRRLGGDGNIVPIKMASFPQQDRMQREHATSRWQVVSLRAVADCQSLQWELQIENIFKVIWSKGRRPSCYETSVVLLALNFCSLSWNWLFIFQTQICAEAVNEKSPIQLQLYFPLFVPSSTQHCAPLMRGGWTLSVCGERWLGRSRSVQLTLFCC